jgi:hypothetical protein
MIAVDRRFCSRIWRGSAVVDGDVIGKIEEIVETV